MYKKGDEIVVSESDLKWWWFLLHPAEAMIFAHYGETCWYKDIPNHMKRALKKNVKLKYEN